MVRLGWPVLRMLRADRRTALVAGSVVLAVVVLFGVVRAATGEAATPAAVTPPPATVTIAFAGDVHFAGSSAAALDSGLGSAATVLKAADLAVVNLETAVTTRGTPEPKTFTFRAPPRAFAAISGAGIDAVTMANNHGMDYGRVGLRDSLAAASAAKFPVLGAGLTDAAAFAPLRRTIKGVRISVFAATDVLDAFAVNTWTATPTRPGLASIKGTGLTRLVNAVRAEKSSHRADVVAVVLHWGSELRVCPTARQLQVARTLSTAGADVVAGSHAHVLQPTAKVGRTLVAYGLGNFVFYARPGTTAQTGVLTVTVTKAGVRSSTWSPAVIRSGRPALLTGVARTAAIRAQANRGAGC